MKALRIAAAGFFTAGLAGAAMAHDVSGAPNAAPATAPDTTTAASVDASAANSNATAMSSGATVTQTTVTNGPVPDTAENRAKYGAPMSRTGKHTKPAGN